MLRTRNDGDTPAGEPGVGPSGLLALPPVLDSQAAPALLQLLTERRGTDLRLDGAGVGRIGGQCLQLLLSAHAAWDADRCTFAVVSPSTELEAGLALLGVDPFSPLLQQEHLS